MIGHEIFKKKIGILGLGNIGKELAIRSLVFGLNVTVFDPVIDKKFVDKHQIKIVESIDKLVEDIDILCLCLPLNKNTFGIINKKLIKKSKNKILIVNTSRALIIDQDSLYYLLDNNLIKGYITDVLEVEPMTNNNKLINYENVIITPHVASRTFETVQRQGIMAVENVKTFFKI